MKYCLLTTIYESALDIEGIFRVPGSEKRVQELKAAVNERES